jgi:hypothetical protein
MELFQTPKHPIKVVHVTQGKYKMVTIKMAKETLKKHVKVVVKMLLSLHDVIFTCWLTSSLQ